MRTLLWVALGSALGGLARYGVVDLSVFFLGPELPWGTLLVNVLGSVIIGGLAGIIYEYHALDLPEDVAAFLMTGVCGGFTTFSFFSLQTLTLMAEGAWVAASTYAFLSFFLSLLGVAVAFRIFSQRWVNA